MKLENQYWQKTGLWYSGSLEVLISCSTDLFRDFFRPWGRIFASVCYKSYFWRSGGIFPPFLLFRQLRGLRNQLWWGGMHLTLPGNQFWEVPTLVFFSSRIEKKSCNGGFFCHLLGWAACMQWYAVNCAVEEKKGGDCETNKLEAKPQNQPGSFNPRIPPIRLQEMIKNCQKRNPIKNPNWKFQH